MSKFILIWRHLNMKIRRRRLLQGGLVALGSAGALGGYLVQRSVAQTGCPPTIWNLTAGQTNIVGTVTVWNDATNIYIKYTLDPALTSCSGLGTMHVWVGSDLLDVPSTPTRIPIPGQFDKAAGGASFTPPAGTTTYTFTLPIASLGITGVTTASQICDRALYVFTHAEVCGETAWGGPTGVNIGDKEKPPRWYYYGVYNVCCDFGPPPVPVCNTAYAKGGYVFTTDKKSNPENLPSLKLTRNRWGWAILLPGDGTYTYDIWAGAGLNSTANGVKVGTLTVTCIGGAGSVTYNIDAPYYLTEVHVYAGSTAPTTIAPGQYEYIASFDDKTTRTYTQGVNGCPWIVAHAVVCS
jgi:hypothetical protein